MGNLRWMVKGLLTLALCTAAGLVRADYSVGRISILQGTVSAQTPGDPESHRATLNDVVAEGDQLATGADASVELQFAGVVLELGPSTVIALTRVQTDGFAVFLDRGSLALGRSHDEAPANVTLQGSQIVAYAQTAGRYRLDVDPEVGDEHFSVWLGRASAQVETRELQLFAGQSLEVSQGLAGSMTVGSSGNLDPLDMALADRLGFVRASASTQRLSADWVGAAALDDQGSWLEVSSVGPVWVPFFLPDNWAPYRSGHWAWNGVWGWTWVDDLPWSYVSFHFGRWIWWNNRWAWSPNGRIPLFSPAGFCPAGLRPPPLPNPRRLANVVPAILATGPERRARPGVTGIVASVLSRPRPAAVSNPSVIPRAPALGANGSLPSYETTRTPTALLRPTAQVPASPTNNPLPLPAPPRLPAINPALTSGAAPLVAPPHLPAISPALTSGAVPLPPPLRLPAHPPASGPATEFSTPAFASARFAPAAPISPGSGAGSVPGFPLAHPAAAEIRSGPREEAGRNERPPGIRPEPPDNQHGPGHNR